MSSTHMHSSDIQAAIKRAGVSQSEIARQCDVSASVIGSVIKGRVRSSNLEQKIAEITGIPLRELWPQWYGEAGGGAALSVSGDGNVVAGRDNHGQQSSAGSGAKLTIAEERLLRLFRALEPEQQAEVEAFMRKPVALAAAPTWCEIGRGGNCMRWVSG